MQALQFRFTKQPDFSELKQDTQKIQNLNCALDDIFNKIAKIDQTTSPTNPHFKFKKADRAHLKLIKSKSAKHLMRGLQKKSKLCESDNESQKNTTSKVFYVPSVTISDFNLGKNIGSGKFGDVFICQHKSTGTIYAIKTILKSTVFEYQMQYQLQNQLKIHQGLDHPNIIKLYAHFEDQFHHFLLMQYFPGKELLCYRKAQQSVVSKLVKQVINAVQYLHRRGYAHRDLKPENILISDGIIKICDFGWVADCNNHMRKTFCGTLDYVSPEMLNKQQHCIEVDIWAIGVLIFQLLIGEVPFKHSKEKNNFKMEDIRYPWYVSEQAKEFIGLFLKQKPEDRISLQAALTHAFIKDYQ